VVRKGIGKEYKEEKKGKIGGKQEGNGGRERKESSHILDRFYGLDCVTGRWVCDDRFYGLVNRSNR